MPRPARESKPDLKRVQMDLPPKALTRLKRLQEVTEAASYAEVIRNALRLYETIINEHEAGGEFLIKRNESLTPLHVFSG